MGLSSQTVIWIIRLGALWTDPETLCRLAASSRQFQAANDDEHWKSVAINMVLRPLQAEVQVRAFQEVAGSSGANADTLKTKVLKLYYPVFQVRCRVRSLWKNIELLWEQMLPEALDSLLPGIGEKELEEVEEKLGCQFPEDLAESFRVHEGMNASGPRQGQFLFELDREDPHIFATLQLRPARQLPDLVEEERRKANAKIPPGGNFRAAVHSFMAPEISLAAIAYLERERKCAPAGLALPLFASNAHPERSENILVAFPCCDRMTVLQAISSELEQYPGRPLRQIEPGKGLEVSPFGAVAFLRIFGFCGPTWYGHANCFEDFLIESLGMLQTIQFAWSRVCTDCDQSWFGWHCPKCKRIMGESFPDALERVLPVQPSRADFDRFSWWSSAVRAYGWACPEYLDKRMRGQDAPFLGH